MFPRPKFFEGAKMNFAENLLFPIPEVVEDSVAVIAATEITRETVTWKELRERVRKFQASLKACGVHEGDRIAGYVANQTKALIAMLAASSLGAIWTAVSPDTGVHAVLERLTQIEPIILFSESSAYYNGKNHDTNQKLREILPQLPTLKTVVIFSALTSAKETTLPQQLGNITSATICAETEFLQLASSSSSVMAFKHLPPDHPVYILYSSGTTGKPKCIVHGAIGTLIQHKKEHSIHCSLGPSSRLLYFTTCTWMMWHWLVSALACGATVILYDGSPYRYLNDHPHYPSDSIPDDLAMPRLISELRVTHFGTSAKYLSILEQKQIQPLKTLDLSCLQAIYSTGSPLAPSTFRYVYSAFPPSINLGSITGGTDIISLFGAPNPLLPVVAGEIQGPGLGMAIRCFDFDGNDITDSGESGDLVCIRPFPCQPVEFWRGKDGMTKYKAAYFETYGDRVWHHGDFVKINPATGGLVMLGRSDGVLKPSGVRFGSSEIYNVVLAWFGEEVSDALCVGMRRKQDTDEIVVLFLKMAEGKSCTNELVGEVKRTIRQELSARHVPGIIDECPDIPITVNGKKYVCLVDHLCYIFSDPFS
jgi:acetoacetyl-CoA synthetase